MIVNRHYCRNNQGEKDSEIKPPLKGTSFCPEYKGSKKRKSMIRVAMIFQDVRGNNTAACTYSHTETLMLTSALM